MMLEQIAQGFSIPFQGVKFLYQNKKLMTWVWLPVLLNLIIYAVFFIFAFWAISRGLNFLDLDIWYEKILYFVIISVGIVLAVFFIIFTFVALTNVIGAPFYEILSRKTAELLVIDQLETPHGAVDSIKIFAESIGGGIKRLVIFTVSQLALLLISLLPLIGATVITIFNIFITAWFLAMEFLDFEFDRREWSFDKKMAVFKKNKWSMLGFGLAIFVGSMIPVFNLIFLPGAVVSASLYFKEFLHKK
ncbi:MAG: EI24 domain-containing protein [Patescibacteria group bacterium]